MIETVEYLHRWSGPQGDSIVCTRWSAAWATACMLVGANPLESAIGPTDLVVMAMKAGLRDAISVLEAARTVEAKTKRVVNPPAPEGHPDIRGPFPVVLRRIEYLVGTGTDWERWVEEYRDDEGQVLFRRDPIEEMRAADAVAEEVVVSEGLELPDFTEGEE